MRLVIGYDNKERWVKDKRGSQLGRQEGWRQETANTTYHKECHSLRWEAQDTKQTEIDPKFWPTPRRDVNLKQTTRARRNWDSLCWVKLHISVNMTHGMLWWESEPEGQWAHVPRWCGRAGWPPSLCLVCRGLTFDSKLGLTLFLLLGLLSPSFLPYLPKTPSLPPRNSIPTSSLLQEPHSIHAL